MIDFEMEAELERELDDDDRWAAYTTDQPTNCCDAARIYGGDCAHTIDEAWENGEGAMNEELEKAAAACDCGKGEWCPQFGEAFARSADAALATPARAALEWIDREWLLPAEERDALAELVEADDEPAEREGPSNDAWSGGFAANH